MIFLDLFIKYALNYFERRLIREMKAKGRRPKYGTQGRMYFPCPEDGGPKDGGPKDGDKQLHISVNGSICFNAREEKVRRWTGLGRCSVVGCGVASVPGVR